MGDTDFLIRGKDRLHCHQLMCSLHYTPKEDPGAVWTYSDGVVTYEIHSHMFYEPLANQVDYQSYFDQAWRFARPLLDTSRYELDEGFHFLYLMAHTAKHIINKGCGLRPFLDMVFFIQQQNRNMNWVLDHPTAGGAGSPRLYPNLLCPLREVVRRLHAHFLQSPGGVLLPGGHRKGVCRRNLWTSTSKTGLPP